MRIEARKSGAVAGVGCMPWTRLAAAALLLWSASARAAPDQATAEYLEQSLVAVRAAGCNGAERTGSGFVWREGRVVTALHLVVGCDEIEVRESRSGALRQARPVALLRDAGLALLELSGGPTAIGLSLVAAPPRADQPLKALGFPLGAAAARPITVKSAAAGTLNGLLSDGLLRQVYEAGLPSPTGKVLRLAGHLPPGMSGAPIVDDRGRLVAVALGGLESGAARIAWGVPAAALESLWRSTDSPPENPARIGDMFAADTVAGRGESVACGEARLTRLHARSFEAMLRTAADPLTLLQFAELAGGSLVDVRALEFDIYLDPASGATVVVPAGAELEPDEGGCRVEAARGDLALVLKVGPHAGGEDGLEGAVTRFERDRFGGSGAFWRLDPNWTELPPGRRHDGLRVRYKGAIGLDRSGTEANHYAFEALLDRGDAFTGAIAFNGDMRRLGDPTDGEFRRDWAAMFLAVALCTYAVG